MAYLGSTTSARNRRLAQSCLLVKLFRNARLRGRARGSKMAAKGNLMLAKLKTFSLLGIEALPVEVEVDVSPGALPKTVLVGLPEAAVKESTHRVERAIVNSGFQRPQDRIVINLAPAELPKQAASFDLPISLGILAGSGQIAVGAVRQVRGRRRTGAGRQDAADQGRPVDGHRRGQAGRACAGWSSPARARPRRPSSKNVEVIPVASLTQAVGFFAGELDIEPTPSRLDELFETFSTVRRRFRRRARPGDGQAGDHDRRRRRAQSADDRPARLRQDDAGQAGADDPARR